MLRLHAQPFMDAMNAISTYSQLFSLQQPGDSHHPAFPRRDFEILQSHVAAFLEACRYLGLPLCVASAERLQAGLAAAGDDMPTGPIVGLLPAHRLPIHAALREIQSRVKDELGTRVVLVIPEGRMLHWEPTSPPFGQKVRDKFGPIDGDVAAAGRCLALGEGTAAIFHLMRAMEFVVQRLAKRLQIAVTPRTTWRMLTGYMDQKITRMPEATAAQRQKKEAWKEARTNLHHVGDVWRNKTMHPARSYTPTQAQDVFNAVRVFMNGLAEL